MAQSSTKEPSRTHTITFTTFFFFVLLLILLLGQCTPLVSGSRADFVGSASLKVTPSEFISALREAIAVAEDVASILSKFSGRFSTLRLAIAILDCIDLLDLSSDLLNWSVSATQNLQGNHNSTGNLGSDLKTWLSAVLSNPDTCLEGFEGTSTIVKGLVSTGLGEMMTLAKKLLTKIDIPNHVTVSDNFTTSKGRKFPSWVREDDKKLLEANGVAVDAVVASDGTGNFTKIMDAVMAAPDYSMRRFMIYVKRGVYNEYVEIKKKKWNIMMIGDGIGATVITGNRNVVDGWTTFRSATFAVSGRGFIARDITFQNTAGPEKRQAVALRSDSDLSVFYRCGIFGYQDSLYTHTMRQFYRECTITGTVDFIFGDATVVFQKCKILVKKGLPNQKNTITAQGRKDPNQPTGYSIQFCNITADSDPVASVNTTTETYLGRPWKTYSRTIVMQSYMSEVIRPQGWLEWNGNFALNTLYYAEYMNTGAGAGVAKRVTWSGYHVLNSSRQASHFTVAQFIEGNLWLPATGVAFTAGFTV